MCLVLAAIAVARDTRAQDLPRLGLTMGYPTAVGVIWNVADRVALRPEMTIGGGSASSTGTSSSPIVSSPTAASSDNFSIGAGLSALFYVKRWDALRAYVSPRFAYTHARSSTGSPSSVIASSSEGTSRLYTTTGSFGAEYSIGRRFGVFGEVGFGYSSLTASTTTTVVTTFTSGGIFGVPAATTTSISTARTEGDSKNWGLRSAVGVIFYF
jgi:hypothetical protein